MNPGIISAIIGACGSIASAIVAAIIAAISARKIVKENVSPRFRAYADKSHNAKNILVNAKHDVFVVAAIGDSFFEKYRELFEKLLSRGVNVHYLILTKERLNDAEKYMYDEKADTEYRAETIGKLKEFKEKYKNSFEVREFDSPMTASYICVDIMMTPPDPQYFQTSVIQMMIYQYMTAAKYSPITYISPKTDEKAFLTTVECIKQMWFDSKDLL